MITEVEIIPAKKNPTIVVPGTEGQVARRIAEAISAHNEIVEISRESKAMPVTSLFEAGKVWPQAILPMKSLAQAQADEPTMILANGNNPFFDVHLSASPQSWGITADDYLPLPARKAGIDTDVCPQGWLIEMCDVVSGIKLLRFNILGDAIIGRGPDADINLEPYGALAQAVSRRHVMLRPTENCLYLIDMESTNGTLYNSVPLPRSSAHAIADGDIIAIGKLSFIIRIAGSPPGH